MNRKNIAKIQDATLKTLAAQVERVLSVAKIRGWEFPTSYDLGVTVLASTAIATKVKVRMDDIAFEAAVTSTAAAEDVAKITDDMVAAWLAQHATGRPTKKRRADG